MQEGKVDMVIVGADRIALNGDAANKTGTYLKALAAYDNNIPFYVAAPLFTFDKELEKGVGEIIIEEREAAEVSHIEGWLNGSLQKVRISPEQSAIVNYGFDITPARLISGFITESGIVEIKDDGFRL
jgi:methylthioribose-1-phosphate isomerase